MTHLTRRLPALATSLVVTAAAFVGVAAPAHAAAYVDLSVSNGTVGVGQRVTATVTSEVGIGFPPGTVTFTANGQQFGSQQVGGSAGNVAQVTWTPPAAVGTAVVATFQSTDGEQASDNDTVTVSRVDTTTSTSTPGSAATSSVVTLAASVKARDGSYLPTGSMTFFRSDGSVIGSSNLDGNARATLAFTTPASAGTVYLYAVFNGDANANPSKRSATDSIKVSSQASSVALVVPQTNYVNSPVQLTAKITPASATGTVDFSVNGKFLGTSKVASGAAVLTWVPNALGAFTLTAKYSGGGGVNAGSASNGVTVTMPLKPDQITLNPVGAAGSWAPGSTNSLPNGATVQFTISSASGLPVALTVSGPCSVNGASVHVDGVGGACTLTAATSGGNGYSPTSQSYTIVTGTGSQTATVSAPASGTYRVGKVLKLSSVSTVTNLNQAVRWKVTKGARFCKVRTAGGYFKLKLLKKGTCTVTGSAPAVPGQWSAYSVMRTYKVK